MINTHLVESASGYATGGEKPENTRLKKAVLPGVALSSEVTVIEADHTEQFTPSFDQCAMDSDHFRSPYGEGEVL